MPTKPCFYAVRVGWIPGVYHTWNECQDQVKGVSGARFKKFDQIEEAWAFVNQPPSPRSSSSRPANALQSQAVGIGQRVQVSPFLECTDIDSLLDSANSRDRVDVTQVEPTSSESPEAGKAGGEEDLDKPEKEIKKKRRRRPSESGEPVLEVDDNRTEAEAEVLKEEATTERPAKKRRRHKAKHVPATHSSNTLHTFFSTYRNPEVLSRLEEIGFGPHELLTMKGLRVGPIARRFRQLIGNTGPQSAAQVESLAFAVSHASAEAWNGLERHIK